MYSKFLDICARKMLNRKIDMKKVVAAVAALVITATSFAQTTWSLDKSHAKLGFSITHLSISEVEGSFKSFDAKITSSKEDFSDAKIEASAQISSINTDNENRDKHLQAPDYFDAAKYPTLTFKGQSFKKVNTNDYKLVGELTMHGVTKVVTLDVYYFGTAEHPYTKKTMAGFKVSGKINRKDFGIAADTPNSMLSDEILIRANLEFEKN